MRIRNIGWRDLVHHIRGGVAQHALGTHIEDLDDTLRICGNTGEICAVEDGALQRASFEQRFFSLLAGSVISADHQVTDNGVLIVAQGGDRNDRREAAAILADVGQFVDILNTARGFEDQGLEAGRNGGFQFNAQGFGARNQFLGVGNIGRCDFIHHIRSRVAQHALRTDIEDLDDTLLVSGDTGKVGAVEDGIL